MDFVCRCYLKDGKTKDGNNKRIAVETYIDNNVGVTFFVVYTCDKGMLQSFINKKFKLLSEAIYYYDTL